MLLVELVQQLALGLHDLEVVGSHGQTFLLKALGQFVGELLLIYGEVALCLVESSVWGMHTVGPQQCFDDELEVDGDFLVSGESEDNSGLNTAVRLQTLVWVVVGVLLCCYVLPCVVGFDLLGLEFGQFEVWLSAD